MGSSVFQQGNTQESHIMIKLQGALCLVVAFLTSYSLIDGVAARETTSTLEVVTRADVARKFLDDHPDRQQQLRRVVDLVKVTTAAAQAVGVPRQSRYLQTDLLTAFLPILLQLIDIFDNGCDLVNAQFPDGEVTCVCTGSLLSNLQYTCSYLELCADGEDGNFCMTPTYKGSLSVFTFTSINQVCASNVTLFQILPLGDLCITLSFDPTTQNLIDCEASFLDLLCLTCTPCDGGGISLQCGLEPGEVPTNCFNFGGLISTANDEENSITEPFTPFTFISDVLLGPLTP